VALKKNVTPFYQLLSKYLPCKKETFTSRDGKKITFLITNIETNLIDDKKKIC